jgi:hypothetical protein
MSPKTTEAHTISFGPADYLQPTANGFIGPDPANPAGLPVVSSLAGYPSDPTARRPTGRTTATDS